MESKSRIKLTEKETERTIEFTIPDDEKDEVTAGLLKNNHLRNLYSDYCILNQEFLRYVVASKLTGIQSRVLFLFMAEMDKENKILINNDLLMKKLRIGEKSTIDAIKRLTELKMVVKQKLDVGRYEYQINYDILNPQLAFKNKATRENVIKHKILIQQETPYIKQYNTSGGLDFINPATGEVFHNENH